MFKNLRNYVFVCAVLIVPALACADIPLSDPEISDTLKRALQQEHRLRDAGIQASVMQGSVTLKGTVETYLDKVAAENLVKRISGVRSVVNWIDVDSVGIDDKRIAEEIRGRIARSSFIRTRDFRLRVSSSVVNLDGNTESWEESEQIERVVREVRGVRDVINHLTPRHASSPLQDAVLAAKVETVLARDAYLAGYPINVAVESGTIRLSGEIPNLFHRERAESEVRSVSGTGKVQNDLVVVSQLVLENLPQRPSDLELQRSVYEELRADPRVPTDALNVEVSEGEVALRGLVDSIFARQVAQRVTHRVFGVARVRNELEVRPIARGDEAIAADLLANFRSDSMLYGNGIEVSVSEGTATLSGEMSSNRVKYHALRVAARVSGVREINNELLVRNVELVTDEFIRQNLLERLAAMTSGDVEKIVVEVDQGRVVLSGTVDRWIIAFEAEQVARTTSGVKAVKNEIRPR